MPKISTLFILAPLIGLISGLCSSAFLYALNWVTQFRIDHSYLVMSLPLFGLVMGWVIKSLPHHVNQGVPYILEELDNEKAEVSIWMTPFIFITSLGTHLFGGSAGREGVGVIMGASSAHIFPKLSDKFKDLRSYLIYCGGAAGFSSIFGTPLAAIVFAFELYGFRHKKRAPLFLATVLSSFTGYLVTHFLGPAHFHFQIKIEWRMELIIYVLLIGSVSGLAGQAFYWGMKGYTHLISKYLPHLFPKLFFGSLFIVLLVYFTNGYSYVGIGSDIIAQSFVNPMQYQDFLMKFLLTIMTLSIGYKGGEVTPLFFMGATLSNFILHCLGYHDYALSAGLGMVSLFGAVSGTPLASAAMGLELFGYQASLLCFFTCLVARIFMMKKTIYRH